MRSRERLGRLLCFCHREGDEYFDLTGKRLKLSDDDRRRLAVKAQALGREALAQIASVATPATLLRYTSVGKRE